MKTFIINISRVDSDDLEYFDEIEGESFDDVEDEIREMATARNETLYICEEGTDRWRQVAPWIERN